MHQPKDTVVDVSGGQVGNFPSHHEDTREVLDFHARNWKEGEVLGHQRTIEWDKP